MLDNKLLTFLVSAKKKIFQKLQSNCITQPAVSQQIKALEKVQCFSILL